jgi:Rrf2 family protein
MDRCTDGWLLAKDIAECSGVPLPYLSKILSGLRGSGIVLAKRGYRGGFRLARPGDQINLLEVVEAIDGPKWDSRCLLGLEECSDEQSCPVHASWIRGRQAIKAKLRQTRLRDLAEFMRTRSRPAEYTGQCAAPKLTKAKRPTRGGVRR